MTRTPKYLARIRAQHATKSPVTFITQGHFANRFSPPALLLHKLTNISARDLAATYISEVCVIAKCLQGKSRLYICVTLMKKISTSPFL